MIYVMTIGSLTLVVLAIVGCATAWGLSRLMDIANLRASKKTRGNAFIRPLEYIVSEPTSAAIYYGLRWLGICILIGWLFSRAV